MSLETWPTKFGKPLVGYDIVFVDPVVREPMEKGDKSRSMYIDAQYAYTYSLILDEAAYHYFRAWFRHKINNGADWFNMMVRENGANVNREAKVQTHTEAPAGNNTHFVVKLELLFRTDGVPSQSALDAWLALP